MKKTLLITLDFPPRVGGVATYLSKLCEHLDHERILVLGEREKNAFIFDQQQPYHIIRSRLLYRWIWPRWLKTYFRARTIVVHEKIEQLIISHALPMGYVAILLGLPFIVIAHGLDLHRAQSNPWKRMWLRHVLQKAKGVVVNSSYTKAVAVEAGALPSSVTIMHPSPQFGESVVSYEAVTALRRKLGLEHKEILLSVGRLVERKGMDRVIESLPGLLEKHPDLHYVIVGSGPYKQKLVELSQKLNVHDRVHFLGSVAGDGLQTYYALADIFIMPARSIRGEDVEGFGIVFLEANALGIPVIGGRSGGVPDAIEDGKTGLLVNPESVSDIQHAVHMLLSNPDLRKEMGVAGKQRVNSEFTWEHQITNINNLL